MSDESEDNIDPENEPVLDGQPIFNSKPESENVRNTDEN